MRSSFAHFRQTLHAAVCGLVLAAAGCATLPPPTAELEAAAQAVARAEAADADQYAPETIAQAREALRRAQAAMSEGRDEDARMYALAAAAEGDAAYAAGAGEAARQALAQRRAEIAALRAQLQMPAEDVPPGGWDEMPAAMPAGADLEARLRALEADPRLAGLAAYERLQARQALAVLAQAPRRERPGRQLIAERRVAVAERAARTEAIRRELERLDRERAELLVEASRREAEAARAEAERLRIEAQIQAEEAARLRAAAEAEAAARAQAEEVIQGVAGTQAARLAEARRREAELARQEAALLAGGTLPPSRRAAGGEVFTLAGDAFAPGQATLTAQAQATLRTLAAYLKAGPAGRIRIVGHTDSQGEEAANQALSERRARAVLEALAGAGVPRARMQASGRGEAEPVADNTTAAGRAKNRRVEILLED